MTLVEICVEDLDGVRAAVAAGADRVELCANLSQGGTTPDAALVAEALKIAPPAGIAVMIRDVEPAEPFATTNLESQLSTIAHYRAIAGETRNPIAGDFGNPGALSFVYGSLVDGVVDEEALRHVLKAAGTTPVCFHRAIDEVSDRASAIETLAQLGVDRILTAGGPANANPEGLRRTIEIAAGRLDVIACGGLREGNVRGVIAASGARQVHMRAPAGNTFQTDPALAAAIVAEIRMKDSE